MRAVASLAALVLAEGAEAQSAPEEALARFLAGPPEAAQFAPAFLDAVPLPQVAAIRAQVLAEAGPVLSVTVEGDRFRALTATHRLDGWIALDAERRIAGLFLEPPIPRGGTVEAALARFLPLGETVAWAVTTDGRPGAARDAGRALNVAWAFKLGVAAVLAGDIGAGRRDWAEVLRLAPRHRSLPTGRLRDFPDGAPVTLHTAAVLMMADSDNTATDLLIETLGRGRIAAALGLADLLTTREMFALADDPARRAEWEAAAGPARAAIARTAAARPLPAVTDLAAPAEFGWPVSADRLCTLAARLSGTPAFAVHSGPVPPDDWTEVIWKGGSLPGVLTFAAAVTARDGTRHCAAVTIHGPAPLDEAAAVGAFRGVLAALGPEEGRPR